MKWTLLAGLGLGATLDAHGQYIEPHERPPLAWWVDLALEPDAASPANRLKRGRKLRDATLSYLDDPKVLAQLPSAAVADLQPSPFAATADLNGNGVPELYRVGFYRTARGGGGNFIAAFEKGRQLDLATAAVSEGRSDFSALHLSEGRLRWGFCLSCGDHWPVELRKGKLRFPSDPDQLELGIRYEEGRGIARDLDQAERLYRAAATDSAATQHFYAPPVGKHGQGRVFSVDRRLRQAGIAEAKLLDRLR